MVLDAIRTATPDSSPINEDGVLATPVPTSPRTAAPGVTVSKITFGIDVLEDVSVRVNNHFG